MLKKTMLSLAIATVAFATFSTAGSEQASAGRCVVVGVSLATGQPIPGAAAIGHGPRGCIRALRRCNRRIQGYNGVCVRQ